MDTCIRRRPTAHVITLGVRDGRPRWAYVGLPGHTDDINLEVDEAVLNRVRMPADFYKLVHAALRPGTTILVTNSRVGAKRLKRLTIMDAVAPRL